MLDAHAYVMQVKLCKANTRGVTLAPNHARRSAPHHRQWRAAAAATVPAGHPPSLSLGFVSGHSFLIRRPPVTDTPSGVNLLKRPCNFLSPNP